MTEKEKYQQCNREAIVALIVYTGYMIWWFVTGYGLNSLGVDALPWVMGLPMWFFLSCIVGWILCVVVVAVVIKKYFRHFDLGDEADTRAAEHAAQEEVPHE